MWPRPTLFRAACFALASATGLRAQNEPVIVQAESGTRGTEYVVGVDGSDQYVAPSTNGAGDSPGSTARVITYSVTFPAAGTYDLYARIRVGAANFNDDSFFYGNGFGAKSPTNVDDWITANGLSPGGYRVATEIVAGEGTAANEVWKWLKLSAFNGGDAPISFTVNAGALTQTFQIGAREDGLWIDKFAFGPTGVTYTVANLDNGQAGSSVPPPAPTVPTGPALAFGKAKWLGSAFNPSSGQSTNFDKYWNQVVPENAGKWGSVEATRNVMNWSALDDAYHYAKTNGFPFRYHTLIWGNQQPPWIETLSTADQLAEIDEWFAAVAARYPDLDVIEVVNEPLHAPPNHAGSGGGNYINALGGSGASGWDWVLNAYRKARIYFPRARLALNDYSVTNSAASAQAYVQIVNLLKAENLIDLVDIQAHAFETTVSAATTRANLDTIAAAGLPIYISELDIDGATDQVQLDDYRRIFPIFWEHPSVRGVTLWGYRPGLWRSAQGAYLVLENGTERPAMSWLKSYIQGDRPVVTTQPVAQSAVAGGTVTLTTTSGGAGSGTHTYQWRRNGADIAGATNATYTIASLQPDNAGLYTVAVTNSAGTTLSTAAAVGVASEAKVIGAGREFAADIVHANGNVYDQVLLTGAAATVHADPGQVLRTSYIDLNNDIVQVEFSGPGSLTISLSSASGPAAPENYNQSVEYMKGHATLTIVGATENTHLSVFTVGTGTAVNQSLFKSGVTYDGIADVQAIGIASQTGRMGGVRCANMGFLGVSGVVGLVAPSVRFAGPVNIENLAASDAATPALLTGAIDTGRIGITGGDMAQPNSAAIQLGDAATVAMLAGADSHNRILPAQTNRAVYQRAGEDVTAQVIRNP